MSTDINETVEARTDRLMGALGLHESFRDTVASALHDMWDAGRDNAAQVALAPARLIHEDARALVERSAVLTRTAHLRILANAEKLLAALGADPHAARVPDTAEPAAEDLLKNLATAIERARDLRDAPFTGLVQRTQIRQWIASAHAARDADDATRIRQLLATPYTAPNDNPAALHADGHDGAQD